jgi:hypothetical protein
MIHNYQNKMKIFMLNKILECIKKIVLTLIEKLNEIFSLYNQNNKCSTGFSLLYNKKVKLNVVC